MIVFLQKYRSIHPKVFLVKDALKICSKFTVEHPFWSVISIKLQSKFIESTLRHGCSQKKSMYIFRTRFTKNTSGRLLLKIVTGFKPIPIFPKNLHYLYLINKFHIITVHFEHTQTHWPKISIDKLNKYLPV